MLCSFPVFLYLQTTMPRALYETQELHPLLSSHLPADSPPSMAFYAGNPLYWGICALNFIFTKDLVLVRGLTMPPQIPISSLLDSDCSAEALRDIQPHVTLVTGLLSCPAPLSVPPEIEDCLSCVIEYFGLLNLEPSQ